MLPAFAYFVTFIHAHLMAVCLALIPSMGVLNRIRGGGYLPAGHSGLKMWGAAAVLTLMTLLVWPPLPAGALGAAYVLWDCLLPWGRWYTLNRFSRSFSADFTWPERAIEWVSDYGGVRRDRIAFFIRNTICFAAGGILLALATGSPLVLAAIPLAALLQNFAYDAGWEIAGLVSSSYGIAVSEHIFGAMWGSAIALGVLFLR